MKSLFVLLLFAVAVSAQVKRPQPPPVKIPFAESLQAVVVTTDSPTATSGKLRLFERKNLKSKWTATDKEIAIVVGRTGLAWAQDSAPEAITEFKKEGDGKSPAGMFPLTYAFGTAEKADAKLKYVKLAEQTECVDDVDSTHYNKIVGRFQVGNFDWESSEKMASMTPEYDLGVFVAHNSYPVTKSNGSCIFLHVWKDATTPTSGCTAMEKSDLERVVAWLDPAKHPYLVQMTKDDYAKYQKGWNLPSIKPKISL